MISVLVCTFGDDSWRMLAERRAVRSARVQDAYEVVVVHLPDGTLADCRNAGLQQVTGDHVIYLDADDELAPGYVAAMRAAIDLDENSLLCPAVTYVRGGRRETPKFWPAIEPCEGNRFVIGTMVRRQLLLDVGGWKEYGWSEDWSTWLRCQKAGARVAEVPDAVYIAHVSRTSKNRRMSQEEKRHWHDVIRQDECPELYEDAA